MRLVLADSTPLYALADPSDQYHRRALSERQRLHQEGLQPLVSFPTLPQTHRLLLFGLHRPFVQHWLVEALERLNLINPLPEDYALAARRLPRFKDQPISLHDATLAVLAQRLVRCGRTITTSTSWAWRSGGPRISAYLPANDALKAVGLSWISAKASWPR